jgi:hypothetical protein
MDNNNDNNNDAPVPDGEAEERHDEVEDDEDEEHEPEQEDDGDDAPDDPEDGILEGGIADIEQQDGEEDDHRAADADIVSECVVDSWSSFSTM